MTCPTCGHEQHSSQKEYGTIECRMPDDPTALGKALMLVIREAPRIDAIQVVGGEKAKTVFVIPASLQQNTELLRAIRLLLQIPKEPA